MRGNTRQGPSRIVRPGAQDEIALSRDKDRLALCINSFSTAPEGVVAHLVDVGAGRDARLPGKDLRALSRSATPRPPRCGAKRSSKAVRLVSSRRRSRPISTPIRQAPPSARLEISGTSCSGAASYDERQKGLRLQGARARRAAPTRVDVQRRRRRDRRSASPLRAPSPPRPCARSSRRFPAGSRQTSGS